MPINRSSLRILKIRCYWSFKLFNKTYKCFCFERRRRCNSRSTNERLNISCCPGSTFITDEGFANADRTEIITSSTLVHNRIRSVSSMVLWSNRSSWWCRDVTILRTCSSRSWIVDVRHCSRTIFRWSMVSKFVLPPRSSLQRNLSCDLHCTPILFRCLESMKKCQRTQRQWK